MLKAHVEDGIVVNLVVVDDLAFEAEGVALVPVLGTSPSIGWTYVDGGFVPPPPVELTPEQLAQRVQQARRLALARIRAGRAAQEVQPVAIAAGTFAADLDSQRRIGLASQQAQDAITAGTPAQGKLDWELLDGTAVTLTARECINLNKAMWKQIEAAATKARALRQQVSAAADVAALDAIVW